MKSKFMALPTQFLQDCAAPEIGMYYVLILLSTLVNKSYMEINWGEICWNINSKLHYAGLKQYVCT